MTDTVDSTTHSEELGFDSHTIETAEIVDQSSTDELVENAFEGMEICSRINKLTRRFDVAAEEVVRPKFDDHYQVHTNHDGADVIVVPGEIDAVLDQILGKVVFIQDQMFGARDTIKAEDDKFDLFFDGDTKSTIMPAAGIATHEVHIDANDEPEKLLEIIERNATILEAYAPYLINYRDRQFLQALASPTTPNKSIYGGGLNLRRAGQITDILRFIEIQDETMLSVTPAMEDVDAHAEPIARRALDITTKFAYDALTRPDFNPEQQGADLHNVVSTLLEIAEKDWGGPGERDEQIQTLVDILSELQETTSEYVQIEEPISTPEPKIEASKKPEADPKEGLIDDIANGKIKQLARTLGLKDKLGELKTLSSKMHSQGFDTAEIGIWVCIVNDRFDELLTTYNSMLDSKGRLPGHLNRFSLPAVMEQIRSRFSDLHTKVRLESTLGRADCDLVVSTATSLLDPEQE